MADRPSAQSSRALYFGCLRGVQGHTQAGHHLYEPDARGQLRPVYSLWEDWLPWGRSVDGGLAPSHGRAEQPQGVAAISHKDGWTALSFWDRSGDSRGNSSSTFLFEATLEPEEVMAVAREVFPDLFDRFGFEVRLAV